MTAPAAQPLRPSMKKERAFYGILGISTMIPLLWMGATLHDVTAGRMLDQPVYLWSALVALVTAWLLGFALARSIVMLEKSPDDPRQTRWKAAGLPVVMGACCVLAGGALGSSIALTFLEKAAMQAEAEWIKENPLVSSPELFRGNAGQSPWFTTAGRVRPEKKEMWCAQVDGALTQFMRGSERRLYGDVYGSLWLTSAGVAVMWREGCVSDAEFLDRSQQFSKAMKAARMPVSRQVLERQGFNPLYWGTLQVLRSPRFDPFGNTPFKTCHAAMGRCGLVSSSEKSKICATWPQDRLVTTEDLSAFVKLAADMKAATAPGP